MERNDLQLITGNCLDELKLLPDESVHCCVTSPPYWGLRDYGIEGQLGLEDSIDEYLATMVGVFEEVRRVLRKDGTLWLNMGDSYVTSAPGHKNSDNIKDNDGVYKRRFDRQLGSGEDPNKIFKSIKSSGLKNKDLVGMPWRLAFALQAAGWYLRQDNIWSKPNPMPESVTDRCTKAHEYVFHFAKSQKYFFDAVAIKEPASWDIDGTGTQKRKERAKDDGKSAPDDMKNGIRKPKTDKQRGHSKRHEGFNERWDKMSKEEQCSGTRNKRSVWIVPPAQFREAHFATYPEKLIEPCILAGTSAAGCCPKCGAPWQRTVEKTLIPTKKACKTNVIDERDAAADKKSQGNNRQKDGHIPGWINSTRTLEWISSCRCNEAEPVPCTVLDPFNGAGTTGLVSLKNRRKYIGIELNPKYMDITIKRLADIQPNMF